MINVTYEITKVGSTTVITTKQDGVVTANVGVNGSIHYYIDSDKILLKDDVDGFLANFRFDENNVTTPAAGDIDALFAAFGASELFSGSGGGSGLPNPLPVFVTNQLDLSTLESEVGQIRSLVDSIDGSTDELESKLDSLIALIQTGNLTSTQIVNELGSILTSAQNIDANTDNIEPLLQTIINEVTPNSTEVKQDVLIDRIERGLFEEVPAWVTSIDPVVTGLYPFSANFGVEFDDSSFNAITSFGTAGGPFNTPADVLNYLRANTTAYTFDLDSNNNLIVKDGTLSVANLYRIDFINGPQIGFTPASTVLESDQKDIRASLKEIELNTDNSGTYVQSDLGVGPNTYSAGNFKEIEFVVLSGTVDVQIGSGATVTYSALSKIDGFKLQDNKGINEDVLFTVPSGATVRVISKSI